METMKSYSDFATYPEYQAYMVEQHKQRILDIDSGNFNHFGKSFRETLRRQSLWIVSDPKSI